MPFALDVTVLLPICKIARNFQICLPSFDPGRRHAFITLQDLSGSRFQPVFLLLLFSDIIPYLVQALSLK